MEKIKMPEELKREIRFSDIYVSVKQFIPDVKYTELKIAMDEVDLDELFTKAMERVKVREWRGEPIGRARTAAEVRKAHGLDKNDLAYLVYVDDRPVLFQPHNPFNPLESKLTRGNIERVMEEHRKRVAFSLMRRDLTDVVVQHILRYREESGERR